jgi:hypothetical protein
MRRKKTFSIFWLMQKASTFGPFGSLKLKNRPQIWSLCKKLCGKTTYLTKKYHLGKSQRLSTTITTRKTASFFVFGCNPKNE